MSALAVSPATLAAIVITLSFAAGLNVYLTVFSLGAMARLHWIVLPDGLGSLSDTWIMVASGALFAGGFFADKIPGFDLIWNALHTFIRIPLAAVMAYGVGEHLSPEMHLLVTCLGAMIAAIAHGSKTALRVVVTPSPEPVSNIALSTAEDGVALGLTALVLHHPLVAGGIVAVLTVACMVGVWLGFRVIRRAFRGLFKERRQGQTNAAI
jgi:Domain of unknown function (DUF4126)